MFGFELLLFLFGFVLSVSFGFLLLFFKLFIIMASFCFNLFIFKFNFGSCIIFLLPTGLLLVFEFSNVSVLLFDALLFVLFRVLFIVLFVLLLLFVR